jgi:nucleoside-diphosphate-sugar epimerase
MSTKQRVLVTGGAGYCGSVLVPDLLREGHEVTVFDILYFGKDHLPLANPRLSVVRGDIRDTTHFAQVVAGHDTVVHLACISNDASFELDPALSTSVNLDAFEPMVRVSKESKVKRFVYASSSSVYGVSNWPDVKEEHPLVPLTLYNRFKGECEPLLWRHTDEKFTGVVFRPATVCGFSPRQRLDLSVNILTNHAVNKSLITVFGGEQLRPNLHIGDYSRVVRLLMRAEVSKVANQTFNVGAENLSMSRIAKLVQRRVEELNDYHERSSTIKISFAESNDNRSYHINSDKIKRSLGFVPRSTVDDAIKELYHAFHAGKLPNPLSDEKYFNVKTLKSLQAA